MRLLYRFLSIWGDMRAISRGTYGKRLLRKSAHRQLAREMRRWLR
jgi:hypothetical protein